MAGASRCIGYRQACFRPTGCAEWWTARWLPAQQRAQGSKRARSTFIYGLGLGYAYLQFGGGYPRLGSGVRVWRLVRSNAPFRGANHFPLTRFIAARSHDSLECSIPPCTIIASERRAPEILDGFFEAILELHFGALGLLFDNTIVYSHTLPGCSMSKEAFEATVRTVATIADHYDDEVVAMAGGMLGRQSGEEMANEASATA